MIKSVYPTLLAQGEKISDRNMVDTVAALAEGYSFPTNLDTDPPVGGNAPRTARDCLQQALMEGWTTRQLMEVLDAYDKRRLA